MKIFADPHQLKAGTRNLSAEFGKFFAKVLVAMITVLITKRQGLLCQGDLIVSANTPCNLISLFSASNRD